MFDAHLEAPATARTPRERLSPLERARRTPKSLRRAVNAMCWQCEGEDADPCVAWRIGNCEIRECALWPVRPHQRLAGRPTPRALR